MVIENIALAGVIVESKKQAVQKFTSVEINMHKRQSTVWNKVRPFYERDILNIEIAEITGLDYKQVSSAIAQNKRRPEWNQVKLSDHSSRKTRTRMLGKEHRWPILKNREMGAQFANLLFESGLIPEDLSTREELHQLYALRNRKLPESNFDKLGLEVFLLAQKELIKGNKKTLNMFQALARRITGDASLIRTEQAFVKKTFLAETQLTSYLKRGLSVEEAEIIAIRQLPKVRRMFTQNEVNSIIFIREAWKLGLLNNDTSEWQKLPELYKRGGRVLPKSNFDKLRLETFLRATVKHEYEGKLEPLTLYNKSGYAVGYEWFKASLSDDEHFIKNRVRIAGLKQNSNDDPGKRDRIREMVRAGTNGDAYKKGYDI